MGTAVGRRHGGIQGTCFCSWKVQGCLWSLHSVLVNALRLSSEAWGFLLFRFVLTPCDFLVQETLCFN